MSGKSGAPSSRSLLTSLGFHSLALLLLMLIPAQAMRSNTPVPELEVVFHRARPPVEVPKRAILTPGLREKTAVGPRREGGGKPAPAAVVDERPSVSESPGTPNLPPGAEAAAVAEVQPQRKVGEVGILAFRDKFASLSRDKVVPRLGADARYSAADDTGKPSSRTALTTS